MEFLTKPECVELARKVGLDSVELLKRRGSAASLKRTATLTYKSRMKNADVVSSLLAQRLGDFDWSVLWPYEFPWGDRSREETPPTDWREYAQWRQTKGEGRSLYDAPGHKFERGEHPNTAKAIEFAIYAGWDAVVFGSPLQSLFRLSHDDYIELHARSREELSATAMGLVQLGLALSQ
ncbi:MAG TPA: hypothetical protein VGR70_16845 [Stellaceae bacterium]|nr:hypothetical protein [Stellaceae bacterium]